MPEFEGLTELRWHSRRSNVLVKHFAACLALMVAASSYGQTADMTLKGVLSALRTKPAMTFSAVGTESRGFATHPIEVDVWSDLDSSTPRARIKVTSFYDGKFRYGWAGDGVQLFHYDPLRNEYTAFVYGAYTGKQPDRMVDSVLQSLVAESKGSAVLPIRFLRDIYAGDGQTYHSWMPDSVPVEVSTKTVHTVTFETNTRKLLFTLDPTTAAFVSLEYWDVSGSGIQAVSTHWTLTATSLDAVPSNWDFSFAPPAGCRPVSLVHN